MVKTKQKLFSYGNSKLPKTTAIFNMGPAKTCPSLKLGLCQAMKDGRCVCYNFPAERLYPQVLPYRQRQAKFWIKCVKNWDVEWFISELISGRKPSNIKYLRLNESGDFYGQQDVTFAECVAMTLWDRYKIITYGYTARKDLRFDACDHTFFRILGSGFWKSGLYGKFVMFKKKESLNNLGPYDKVCPGDCKKCSRCMTVEHATTYIVKHGRG